ncbi:hypothetical protein [Pseudobutyrivibrio sp.]|uniref:hypothetical protein n=1 Tax=Pseudobutyrivibrio sp. TaxID=2014367 RepID=UPI0038630559
MSNTANQISNLMQSNGKTAAEMTHAVKELGNGSMQAGFQRIGAYFDQEIAISSAKALSKGRIEGTLIGIGITAIVIPTTLYVKRKISERKEHESEGKKILKTFSTSFESE